MKEKNVKKHSAIKKLIPAVGMLAMSAVMLSSATYAWFTMNKEVQLTGLNMTATTGEGIEISLAKVASTDKALTFQDTMTGTDDGEDNIGWSSAVVVGNYYEDIGKLKPASSVNAVNFFDATDASNAGKTATKFIELTPLNSKMATVTKRSILDVTTSVTSNGTEGYYVDIPVHLRTTKVVTSGETPETEKAVYYKMVINNNEDSDPAKTNNELYKAVRVAFIKGDGTSTVISGENSQYYNTGAVSEVDGDGNGTKTAVTVKTSTDKAVYTDNTSDVYKNSVGCDSGLVIPYATQAGQYGHLDFTVRVWLEGESTYCFNNNAGQQWNINLAFSMGEFETTP